MTSWDRAWADAMHFVGDPFDTLAPAIADDPDFVLGSVFCAVYRILGGSPPDAPELVADVERARAAANAPRERMHLEALEDLIRGDFTVAAKRWDTMDGGLDFAAVRFAHDVYLHVGDAPRRLRSSQRAIDRWTENDPWWSLVAGQHSFSLEEAGFYGEAEALGHRALDADPMDLWALHALAHVYETLNDSATSVALLRERESVWSTQDQLSVHIWWHLALRLMAQRLFDEVLDIHDSLVSIATTPFRLCDLISLLWRLELEGVDVGARWESAAAAFSIRPERHTSGFLDLHAALVFARVPQHPAAADFFDGAGVVHARGETENNRNFREVVAPLVEAVRISDRDPLGAVAVLDRLGPHLHRIGGSVAQRDIIGLTRRSLHTTAPEDS